MHVNTAGIEEQLILRKRKPAIFQKDFLVPSECYLLLYLDFTDYKATSYLSSFYKLQVGEAR